jgi:sporulation protein YlmC with PRC-barrel domain
MPTLNLSMAARDKPRKSNMNKAMMLAAAALIGGVVISSGAIAQGAPQTVELTTVDVQTLAGGYRASKVIGSNVLNADEETIGQIEDVLVSSDGKQPYAVLSIGGFLGMGSHLVIVPYQDLKFVDQKVILYGGSKASLTMLPEFIYATN